MTENQYCSRLLVDILEKLDSLPSDFLDEEYRLPIWLDVGNGQIAITPELDRMLALFSKAVITNPKDPSLQTWTGADW